MLLIWVLHILMNKQNICVFARRFIIGQARGEIVITKYYFKSFGYVLVIIALFSVLAW